MSKKKSKKNKIDHSKEHFGSDNAVTRQDPTGSYTAEPIPAISDAPVQDADDL